jgi:hypothetical protein
MPFTESTSGNFLLDACGEVKEAHRICNRCACLPRHAGDLFLGHAELVGEAAVSLRRFDWGEIAALHVFDQRELKA